MVEYEYFNHTVCDEIKRHLNQKGLDLQLIVKKVNTINEQKDEISILDSSKKDSNALFPTLYINDLYDYYKKCGDLYVVIDVAVNAIERAYKDLPNFQISKELIQKNLFFTIINREKNKELLENVPHREFEDLAIIYRVKITDDSNTILSNDIIKSMGVNEEELYQVAYKNTAEILGNIYCTDLDNLYIHELRKVLRGKLNGLVNENELKNNSDFKLDANKLFILKYGKYNEFGSSVVLYNDKIEELANTLNDDLLIVFPSSDEMVVTSLKNENIEEIKQMCKENPEIPKEKFLSNNSYVYDRNKKKIYIQTDDNVKDEIKNTEINHRRRAR